MTAELRKYGVGLVLAHQYFHQLEPDVRHAVLGNAGTLISFRVGSRRRRLARARIRAGVRDAKPHRPVQSSDLSASDD